jgi:hypothetical protein
MKYIHNHTPLNEELVETFLSEFEFTPNASVYFELIALAIGHIEVEDFMRWHLTDKHQKKVTRDRKDIIDSLENTIMFLDRNERVNPLVLEALSMVVQKLREL